MKRALIGKGVYGVKEEYQHLMTDENTYWCKNKKQRADVYSKFLKAPLKPHVPTDDEVDPGAHSKPTLQEMESNRHYH